MARSRNGYENRENPDKTGTVCHYVINKNNVPPTVTALQRWIIQISLLIPEVHQAIAITRGRPAERHGGGIIRSVVRKGGLKELIQQWIQKKTRLLDYTNSGNPSLLTNLTFSCIVPWTCQNFKLLFLQDTFVC